MVRKIISGIMSVLLVLSMFSLLSYIQPVLASGTIYIRADGSIDPPDAPISTVDNVTYTLTDTINSSIVVEKDSVMVDGAGYTVQGTGSGIGIDAYERSNVIIKSMEITAFGCGIFLGSSSNSVVSGNNVANNGLGIEFVGASNNVVSGNNVTNNVFGIEIGFSSNIVVFHNNFVNNAQQVATEGSASVLDNGYPSGGNFWSDYTGVDVKCGPSQNISGSDGIGDTPYIIDANNTDNYPLMKPYTIETPSTTLYVDPPTINATPLENSTVALKIENVTDLHGWQVRLEWDPLILDLINATEGDFGGISVIINQTGGCAFIGGQDLGGANGSGTLSNIVFQGKEIGNCELSLYNTRLFSSNPELVPTPPNLGDTNNDSRVTMSDLSRMSKTWGKSIGSPGYDPNADFDNDGLVFVFDYLCIEFNWETIYPPPPAWAERPVEIPHVSFPVALHDTALTEFLSSKTVVGQGYIDNMSVTLANQGTFIETSNVTLYAGSVLAIQTQNVTLAAGNSTTVTFTWNTTGFAYGNYTISAYAWPVPGETSTEDNNSTSTVVTVTIPGDINGDLKCALADLSLFAKAFNTMPGYARWNPNADINGNGIVGLSDLSIMAKHFNQHYP